MIEQQLIENNGYSGIQSAKPQYRISDGRNARSEEFYVSAKDDACGVDHPDEVRDKVRDKVGDKVGYIFVLGSIQKGMQHTSKHTSKHV